MLSLNGVRLWIPQTMAVLISWSQALLYPYVKKKWRHIIKMTTPHPFSWVTCFYFYCFNFQLYLKNYAIYVMLCIYVCILYILFCHFLFPYFSSPVSSQFVGTVMASELTVTFPIFPFQFSH